MHLVLHNWLDAGPWDPSKHPRGQPENKGEFAETGGGGSSAESQEVLKEYSAEGYVDINKKLRAGEKLSKQEQAFADKLDRAIAEAPPSKKDMVLYRGVPEVSIANFEGKSEISEPGYMSATKSLGVATRFVGYANNLGNVRLEITVPKGSRILDVEKALAGFRHAGQKREQEMLLPRGTTLRIDSVTREPVNKREQYGNAAANSGVVRATLVMK